VDGDDVYRGVAATSHIDDMRLGTSGGIAGSSRKCDKMFKKNPCIQTLIG